MIMHVSLELKKKLKKKSWSANWMGFKFINMKLKFQTLAVTESLYLEMIDTRLYLDRKKANLWNQRKMNLRKQCCPTPGVRPHPCCD